MNEYLYSVFVPFSDLETVQTAYPGLDVVSTVLNSQPANCFFNSASKSEAFNEVVVTVSASDVTGLPSENVYVIIVVVPSSDLVVTVHFLFNSSIDAFLFPSNAFLNSSHVAAVTSGIVTSLLDEYV